jgi:hypothetical protein
VEEAEEKVTAEDNAVALDTGRGYRGGGRERGRDVIIHGGGNKMQGCNYHQGKKKR